MDIEKIVILIVAIVGLAIYALTRGKDKVKQKDKIQGEATPATEDESFKNNIAKSAIDFGLTVPFSVIYYLLVPKIIHWFIPLIILPWAYIISAILFMPVIGAIRFLCGEHWKVGKKGLGFALLSFIVLIISSLYIFYPEEDPAPAPTAQIQSQYQKRIVPFQKFSATKNEQFVGILHPGEKFVYISPVWINVRGGNGKQIPCMPSQNPSQARRVDELKPSPGGYRVYVSSIDQAAIIEYRITDK